MSTSKASSPLKYSIATFLLCTSALTTGVFIYPISLAILNATTIPLLFVAIASVSAIIALSSTVYLVKSAIFTINNKNTCNILEEKLHGNDTSTPSLPTLNSITNNDISIKTPEKMSALQVPQVSVPAPPPFPNQGVSVPPPPPLPTEGLNNWKLQKDSAISKKLLDSGSSKNSSFTKPKDNNEGLQEELKKFLEKRRKNSQHLSNAEIKDSNELKKQEEYAIRIDSKLEEKKKQNRDEGTVAAVIREKINSIRQYASFSNSESEHSGNEDGWSDDNQDIQSSKKKEGKKLIEAQKSMPSTTNASSAPFIPAPPPFPNQGVSVPPPPPLPTEGLNNWKLQKDSAISKKLLDSGSSKNSSFTKPKDNNEGLQEELKKFLEKRRKNSQHLSNAEIKDSNELKKQEEYAIRIDSKLEEKKKQNRDEGTVAAVIREKINSIRQYASFSNSESEHSGNEYGWSDDNQDIQSSKKKEGKKLIEAQKSMPSTTNASSAPFIPAPPPFPNQGVSVPPPPPLPTEGLNNWKLQKDSAISKKLLDSGSSKNSSFTKPKDNNEGLQEELKKFLEKRRKNSQHLSNVEIKDSTELKTQEEYVARVEKQQEEKNQVESQNNHDFIRSMILEYILPSIEFTDIKKVENSGQSSGYASDLEEDQPPKSKNLQLLPTTVMKIDNVDPINSEAKKSSLWKKLFKKPKKKAEQKTPECISKV